MNFLDDVKNIFSLSISLTILSFPINSCPHSIDLSSVNVVSIVISLFLNPLLLYSLINFSIANKVKSLSFANIICGISPLTILSFHLAFISIILLEVTAICNVFLQFLLKTNLHSDFSIHSAFFL